MTPEDILFHGFAAIATITALMVIVVSNPVYSALFLALTMSVLGAIFFTLQGYFVAVAQITVYAGAVMVLFVMVLMLFDLSRERDEAWRISPLAIAKFISAALVCGFLVGTGWLATIASANNPATTVAPNTVQKDLAKGDQKLPPPQAEAPVEPPQEAAPNSVSATEAISKQPQNPDDDLTNAEAKALVDKAPQLDEKQATLTTAPEFGSTVSLSVRLFTKYVFAFEAVSLLLLIAIVGAVALARSRGGTHHAAR